MRVSTPAGKIPASRVKWLPMVLASAKRPYSDTIAAMPGNTASSAKKATPPEVEATLSAEIDQNTRQAISPPGRFGLYFATCSNARLERLAGYASRRIGLRMTAREPEPRRRRVHRQGRLME